MTPILITTISCDACESFSVKVNKTDVATDIAYDSSGPNPVDVIKATLNVLGLTFEEDEGKPTCECPTPPTPPLPLEDVEAFEAGVYKWLAQGGQTLNYQPTIVETAIIDRPSVWALAIEEEKDEQLSN